jgi:chromate reductase
MHPLNKPEVFVNFASRKFDDEGRLLDEKAKELIGELLINLIAPAKRLKMRELA